MKTTLVKLAWLIFIFFLFYITVELVSQPLSLIIAAISMLILFFSVKISNQWIKRLSVIISTFLICFILLNTFSFYGMLLSLLGFLLLFQTKQGNKLFWLKEMYLHPLISKQTYSNLQLIAPLEQHRSLIYKQELNRKVKQSPVYEWNDINISTIGGDAIIDLGETVFPEKENLIILQKIFGKTRLIIPKTMPIKLNISLIIGKIYIDSDVFPMTSDNFRWKSKEYDQQSRKLNINITSVTGDIEVIRL